jgi:hypothetical protein
MNFISIDKAIRQANCMHYPEIFFPCFNNDDFDFCNKLMLDAISEYKAEISLAHRELSGDDLMTWLKSTFGEYFVELMEHELKVRERQKEYEKLRKVQEEERLFQDHLASISKGYRERLQVYTNRKNKE